MLVSISRKHSTSQKSFSHDIRPKICESCLKEELCSYVTFLPKHRHLASFADYAPTAPEAW